MWHSLALNSHILHSQRLDSFQPNHSEYVCFLSLVDGWALHWVDALAVDCNAHDHLHVERNVGEIAYIAPASAQVPTHQIKSIEAVVNASYDEIML